MSFPLLQLDGVTAGYERDVPVLHDVTLRVDDHEIVTILGSNGAGKTTVANAASGLVPFVPAGRIWFAGEDVTGLPPHAIATRGLVHAPAGREVFPECTVEENLLVGAHGYRADRRRVRRNVDAMLERFEPLAKRRKQAAGTLSGGEQQVLSIARALMSRPRLLILDEPSMGLAPKTVTQVFDLVRQIHADGVTILLVEKLARIAAKLSDRLYVMELGRVILDGLAMELRNDPRVEEAYLGRRVWDEPDNPLLGDTNP